MSSNLKRYLKKVCFLIKDSKKKRSTYKELRNHILDKIDSCTENSNCTYLEAEKKVLEKMPNAYFYGYKLNKAHQSYWRRHLVAILGLSFGGVSIMSITLFIFVVNYHFLPRMKMVMVSNKKHISQFEEDLKLVSQHPFFYSKKTKNANEYLFVQNKNFFFKKQEDEVDVVSKKILQHINLNSDKNMILNVLRKADLEKIKTDWISDLKNYDYLSGYSPDDRKKITESYDKAMILRIAAVASVNGPIQVTRLQNLMRIRLFQLCAKNKCDQGFDEWEHVAKMIYTTDSLTGHMIAVSMIKQESKLFKIFSVDRKVPLDESVLAAYRRASWGWRGVIDIVLNDQSQEMYWQKYMRPETGFCSSLGDYPLLGFVTFSDFFEDAWMFEADFSKQIQNSRQKSKEWREICGLSEFSPIAEKPKYKQSLTEEEVKGLWAFLDNGIFSSKLFWLNPIRTPYLRQIVGFSLMSFASPNYWGVYERLEEETIAKKKKNDHG